MGRAERAEVESGIDKCWICRHCLQLLLDDYTRQALELTSLGFNGDLLDLELPSVVDTSIPDREEAQIQHLLATCQWKSHKSGWTI